MEKLKLPEFRVYDKNIEPILDSWDWLNKHLKTVREFQYSNSETCIGGSLGLYLHNIPIRRQWGHSDIDFICRYDNIICAKDQLFDGSHGDFQYTILKYGEVKCDICVNPNVTWDYIKYGQHTYRVAHIQNIMDYKIKYMNEGSLKHKNDIEFLRNIMLISL